MAVARVRVATAVARVATVAAECVPQGGRGSKGEGTERARACGPRGETDPCQYGGQQGGYGGGQGGYGGGGGQGGYGGGRGGDRPY